MKRNRFMYLTIAVFVAIGGWFFIWQGLASTAETGLTKAFASINAGGDKLSCEDRKVDGFPFRINVECKTASYTSREGIEVASEGLKTTSLVYRPDRQITSLESPANIKFKDGPRLKLTWDQAKVGLLNDLNGPKATTLDTNNLKISPDKPIVGAPDFNVGVEKLLLTVAKAEGKNLEQSATLGIQSETFSINGLPFKTPDFSLAGSLLFYDVAPVFEDFDTMFERWIKNGGEGKINFLDIIVDRTHMRLKGWAQLDNEGLLSGEIDVDVAEAGALAGSIDQEATQFVAALQGIAVAIEGFGKTSELDGKPAKQVRLIIQRGHAKIGILPLGYIPKLF